MTSFIERIDSEQEQPQLFIEIFEGKNFPRSKDKNTTKEVDYVFCQIMIEKQKLETTTKQRVQPVWYEQFLFLVRRRKSVLRINVMKFVKGKTKHKIIGVVKIPIETLLNEHPIIDWFDLSLHKSFGSKKKQNERSRKPQLRLKVHFTFTKFLLSDDSKVLCILTDIVHSGDADKIAKNIVSVLRNYKKILSFIEFSIEREVFATNSPEQLFRTNSMSTKMMTALQTPSTNAYICSMLKKPILEIMKISYIMDMRENLVSKEDLERNVKQIKKLTQAILDNVFHSSTILPYEYKCICYRMYKCVKKKFPDNVNVCVSGFIFLRVLGPAMINPSNFLNLAEPITKENLKNLVLIAKIIQTLVNGAIFGIKDKSLAILQKWAENNRVKLNEFIQKIVTTPPEKNINNKKNNKDIIAYRAPTQDFYDMVDYMKNYSKKISTFLYRPEDDVEDDVEEDEKNKETLSSFFKTKDMSVTLAIILNKLKKPEHPLAKKSHNITNSEIKKLKAIKITQRTVLKKVLNEFENENNILNNDYIFAKENTRKATIVSEKIIFFFKNVINDFYIKDNKNTINVNNDIDINENSDENNNKEEKKQILTINFRKVQKSTRINTFTRTVSRFYKETKSNLFHISIDWNAIKKSSKYNEFVLGFGELKNVNLIDLNLSEKISFWINIYNSLLIHASIVNESSPESFFTLKTFNSEYKYNISGLLFSRDDIFQGILRAKPNYFPKDDPRNQHVLNDSFVPYIIFGLTDLQITSPNIRVFHSTKVDKELLYACKYYIENNVKSHSLTKTPKLIIPNLFKWNMEIFGGSDETVVEFILSTLSVFNVDLYYNFLHLTKLPYRIEYQDIRIKKKYPDLNNEKSKLINVEEITNKKINHKFTFLCDLNLDRFENN
ncbi:ras gtpase-activating protein [Anaeramoeba flamelloides]|uniref:Ras gtpase-activating protein n=1 Tax=Anaeramoeba flamelloides TaxID=1746091 RepID=A0AAV8A940_9EUKA|nr:ras gtpase-activating protein [Anaeramoeba flamelloides]